MEAKAGIDLNGVVRVLLKLSGVALAVYGAVVLSGYLAMLLSSSDRLQSLVFVSQPAILLAAGLFLWLFPAPVANTVICQVSQDEAASSWADRLVEAGSVLIGLWWLLRSISDLVYHLLMNSAQDDMLGHTGGYDEFGPLMVATVVEFVLALALILGARGIVGLIRKLRHGGLASDDSRQ